MYLQLQLRFAGSGRKIPADMRHMEDFTDGRLAEDRATVVEALDRFRHLQSECQSAGAILIRDTKDRNGAVLSLPRQAWQDFTLRIGLR